MVGISSTIWFFSLFRLCDSSHSKYSIWLNVWTNFVNMNKFALVVLESVSIPFPIVNVNKKKNSCLFLQYFFWVLGPYCAFAMVKRRKADKRNSWLSINTFTYSWNSARLLAMERSGNPLNWLIVISTQQRCKRWVSIDKTTQQFQNMISFNSLKIIIYPRWGSIVIYISFSYNNVIVMWYAYLAHVHSHLDILFPNSICCVQMTLWTITIKGLFIISMFFFVFEFNLGCDSFVIKWLAWL